MAIQGLVFVGKLIHKGRFYSSHESLMTALIRVKKGFEAVALFFLFMLTAWIAPVRARANDNLNHQFIQAAFDGNATSVGSLLD